MDVLRKPKKVLIIDDEPEVISVIKRSLERVGYDVCLAESGVSGLEKMLTFKPNLVLLDVVMPGMNGFDVLKEINSNVATASMPVVMLTAKKETSSIFKAEEYHVADYLIKPIDLDKLVRLVNKLL